MVGRLADRVVVVAGASTGIGRATALRLASEGARLMVGSPASEQALIEGLVEEIRAQGGNAIGTAFDATDDASMADLVALVRAEYGGIDAFHANFADLRVIMEDSDAATVSDDVLERTLDVNLKGMLRATRHAVPALLERGGGAMIYTSSTASIAGEAARPCYAMAKSGLNALMRHVASTWGRQNVRANAIMPGFVHTPERRAFIPQEVSDFMLQQCRLPRLGEPEDIAGMVAFLASRDGDWMTGQCIAVDGGSVLR
ncbi:MAG: SDR family oxidoreductase [Novosphingobium sp.]